MSFVNAGRIGYGTLITRDTGGSVAVMYSSEINPRAAEDTHLFLAAPDLLEALKRAEQFIANGIELGFIRMPTMKEDSATATPKVIRAAIAKAEGR